MDYVQPVLAGLTAIAILMFAGWYEITHGGEE